MDRGDLVVGQVMQALASDLAHQAVFFAVYADAGAQEPLQLVATIGRGATARSGAPVSHPLPVRSPPWHSTQTMPDLQVTAAPVLQPAIRRRLAQLGRDR